VWDHRPTADELLDERVGRGWLPTPTGTVDGPIVLGHAARLEEAFARGSCGVGGRRRV
jgi:hypothetical protein